MAGKLNCGVFVSCDNCAHASIRYTEEPCASCAALNPNAAKVRCKKAKLSDFSDSYSPLNPQKLEAEKRCVAKYEMEMESIREDIKAFKEKTRERVTRLTEALKDDGIDDPKEFLKWQYNFGGSVHLSLMK